MNSWIKTVMIFTKKSDVIWLIVVLHLFHFYPYNFVTFFVLLNHKHGRKCILVLLRRPTVSFPIRTFYATF